MPCVYILTNRSMPGMVKIGQSSRSAAERCREVGGSTGVPTPFKVAHEFDTVSAEAAVRLEKLVFRHLRKQRVDPKREFFSVSVDRAKQVIQEIGDDKHLLFVAPQYYQTRSGVVRQIQEIIDDEEPQQKQAARAAQIAATQKEQRIAYLESATATEPPKPDAYFWVIAFTAFCAAVGFVLFGAVWGVLAGVFAWSFANQNHEDQQWVHQRYLENLAQLAQHKKLCYN